MVKKIPLTAKKTKACANYEARINRIYGQVGGIKKMLESERNSTEILVQLKAVRSAIKALEAEILEAHLQDCAAGLALGSATQKNKKIADLKKVFLRFE